MRPIKVNVTNEHIRNGERNSACHCPIALALKDALITNSVSVTPNGIQVNHASFEMDKKDLRFIERFDAGLRVKPYSFSLSRK